MKESTMGREALEPADDELATAQPALEPEAEHLLDNGTTGGDEEKKSEEIGEEAGGKQQHPADQNQCTVKEFCGRKPSLGELCLDAAQDVKALAPHQPGTGKAYKEQNGHRRHRADQGTDLEDQVNLDDGDNNKEDEEPG